MSESQKPKAPTGMTALFGGFRPQNRPKVTPSFLEKKTAAKDENKDASKDSSSKAGGAVTAGGGGGKALRPSKSKIKDRGTTRYGRVTITESKKKIVSDDEADQDVTMGGTSAKKSRKKRFNPYGSRDKARHVQRNKTEETVEPIDILIEGFQPGTEGSVVPSLQTKSKKAWDPLDVKVDGNKMLLTVGGWTVANAIVRLNGYIFGSDQLSIQLFNKPIEATPIAEAQSNHTIDFLRKFLLSRWNAETKFLNLEDMASDPILRRACIHPPGTPKATEVVGPAMMKLAGEMFQDVVTISLAQNRLRNVKQVSTLTRFLPNVQNLSFSNNALISIDLLDPLCGPGKLPHLRELLLKGNPFMKTIEKQKKNRAYIKDIVKRFPTIAFLDGEAIQLSDEEKASVEKSRAILPVESKTHFFDNDTSKQLAQEFVANFLRLFDNDRAALRMAYHELATFSVSSVIKLSAGPKIRGRQKKMMQDDEKVSWQTVSRDLGKASASKHPGRHLAQGPDMVTDMLQRLPKTFHNLEKAEEFLLDAFQRPSQQASWLHISVHGEFKDEANTLYSFDRSFILQPVAPGSPNQIAGWPYVILSDIFCVRDYRVIGH